MRNFINELLIFVVQFDLILRKLSGSMNYSWWIILIPSICILSVFVLNILYYLFVAKELEVKNESRIN